MSHKEDNFLLTYSSIKRPIKGFVDYIITEIRNFLRPTEKHKQVPYLCPCRVFTNSSITSC